MFLSTYFLMQTLTRNIIIHGESGFKVNVFELSIEAFMPEKDELHIFGDHNGKWLAFETVGWNSERLTLMGGAVHWYSKYIGFEQMQPTIIDPRNTRRLKIVRTQGV